MREFEDEVELTALFKDRVESKYPGLPVDYEGMNTTFAPDGPYKGVLVRFRVAALSDSRFIATQGDIKHYRNYGSVLIQVVGPMGEGKGRILKLGSQMAAKLQSVRSGGILLRTSSGGPGKEDNARLSMTFSIPYQSDYKTDEQGTLLQ